MILVNEKELNLSVPSDDVRFKDLSYNEQFTILKFDEIRKLKSVTIVENREMNAVRMAHKPSSGFPVAGHIQNPKTGVREHWTYSNSPPSIINGQKVYDTLHFTFFNAAIFYPQNDIEIIFFILYVLKSKNIKIENKEAEAIVKISGKKTKSQVEYWILTKSSPEDIIRYCIRNGIQDTVSKTDAELRIELMELLEARESIKDKNGFKKFLEEVNSDSDIISLGTYFMKEVSEKRIVFNPTTRMWCYADTMETICKSVPPNRVADKEEYTIQYLMDHEDERNLFMTSITDDETIALNDDYMLITNVGKLRSYAIKKTGQGYPKTFTLDQGKAWITEALKTKETVQVDE